MTITARRSPAKLARSLFRHDHWDTPSAIMRAVFEPRSKNVVKACHASSKTFMAADCTLLALYAGGDVLTTAQTWASTRNVLWKQVRRALADSVLPPREWGAVSLTHIELPTGEFAVGLNTEDANEGVNFQGYHARPGSFLLVIVDEAPGVAPAILGAIEGIRAGGDVRLLYLGNPVIASGPFYDLFASDAPGWNRWTIDGFDTPNLRGLSLDDVLAMSDDELDTNEREYLITRRYVWEKYHEWGPDHPLWASRVRGQFPLQSEDALLSLAWLEDARRRDARYDPAAGPVSAGIDVAGPGEDETVLCVRQGGGILEARAWTKADARGDVLALLRPWRHRGLARVNVDTAGIGFHFATYLAEELGEGVVRFVNVGAPSQATYSDGTRRFANLKAEYYWQLRERFQGGEVAGLVDQTTIAQLAGIRYRQPRGVLEIEKKEDALKRGVKSPDRAEALMLAFAPEDSRQRYGQHVGKSARWNPRTWPRATVVRR